MENQVISILNKNFKKLKIKKNQNLTKIKLNEINGWDSLSSINFFLKLQKVFDKKFDILKISQSKTVADIIKILKN
tara:strand:+ start:1060 stop:1287 length:228 start_codon:yes stop_codon:yes gene_type:complete